MTSKKLYTELSTIDEFIEYYNGASKRELKAALKNLGGISCHLTKTKDNERQAIIALLA